MLSRLALSAAIVVVSSGMALAKGFGVASGPEEKKAWLGVYLGSVGDEDDGVKIVGLVGDDSPAAIAGIDDGDIIIRFDGRTVSDLKGLVEQIGSLSPGEKVNVDLNRDGEDISVAVVLGTRPMKFELKRLGRLGDHSFSWVGRGPKGIFLRGGDHAWSEELHEILGDLALEDVGKVMIKIECEDGDGTVVIETDGDTETHDFDCAGDWDADKSFAFNWSGALDFDDEHFSMHMPKILSLKIPNLDFDLDELDDLKAFQLHPRIKGYLSRIHVRESANTRFNVDSDGGITVTVTKGDAELNLNFDSAADLQRNRPDLYDKYEDLISELE